MKVVVLLAAAFCLLLASPLGTVTALDLAVQETEALEDVYHSLHGEMWLWREEAAMGQLWNFSTFSGEYLHNPCSSGDNNSTWQGVECSSDPSVCKNESCSILKLILPSFNLAGTLPDTLYKLSALEELVLLNNFISGSIPANITLLQNLEVIDLEGNLLSGPLPEELCSITSLRQFRLGNNAFSGPLIPSLSNLTQLQRLRLHENSLTGTIIPELGQLVGLIDIYMFHNFLTGHLQPSLSRLRNLVSYTFNHNLLSGPLIPEMTSHPNLALLALHDNSFTGTLLPGLGDLQYLQYLYIFQNHITGTMPPTLGLLTNLLRMSFSQNALTGSIPSEFGQLKSLNHLYLYKNTLSGSLPSTIGKLINMRLCSLYNNKLTGSLPDGFSSMSNLQRLLIQNNLLTGHISENVISSDMQMLEIVDMSNNKLSGSIPKSVFKLPRVTTIAFSLNCFQGKLPEDMCSVKELQVLSMDGLGTAKGCKHEYLLPISKIALYNAMEGSIPSCLWNLKNLTVLHLSGNGLKGTIGSGEGNGESYIRDLSLAHNHLSGTVPQQICSGNFTALDLSYNRLNGRQEFQDESYVLPSGSSMILEVNRLSGPLPRTQSYSLVDELNILRDNLFGCGSIPDEDSYSEEYSCGSQQLNLSVYFFLAFLSGLLMAWLVTWMLHKRIFESWKHQHLESLMSFVTHQYEYMYIFRSEVASKIRCVELIKIYNMQYSFQAMAKIVLILLLVIVVSSSPIYAIKLVEYGHISDTYSTHAYQYLWVLSTAFISGHLPAALLIVAWLSTLLACYLLFWNWEKVVSLLTRTFTEGPTARLQRVNSAASKTRRHDSKHDTELVTRHRQISREQIKASNKLSESVWKYFILFSINLVIAFSINFAYVYSTFQPLPTKFHVFFQFCLAMGKTIHTAMILPAITSMLVTSTNSKIQVRSVLGIFNSVFIPGLATAFTSPSCFQNLIIQPPEVSSSYYYRYCSLYYVFNSDGSLGECIRWTVEEMDVIPITPPFSYNNLCASNLLVSYIPVYIFVYSFQAILPFLAIPILTNMDYGSLPRMVQQQAVYGLIWPEFWRKTRPQETSSSAADSMQDVAHGRILFDYKKIYLKVAHHLIILLTFGICSPILAFIVVISLFAQMYSHVYLIGRFVRVRLQTADLSSIEIIDDHAVGVLSRVLIDVCKAFENFFWPLFIASSVFFAFLSWDIVLDVSSLRESSWAPAFCVFAPIAVWLCGFIPFVLKRFTKPKRGLLFNSTTNIMSDEL